VRTAWSLILPAILGLASGCGDPGPPAQPPVPEVRGERIDAAPEDPELAEMAARGLTPASPPHKPADEVAPVPTEPEKPEYADITFELLRGYDWRLPVPGPDGEPVDESIPTDVLALDGTKVCVQGYMLPLDLEAGRTTHFMLMHSLAACCFGGSPLMNEWIEVTLIEGESTDYVSLTPYKAFGVLHVGTKLVDGTAHSVYRMTGDLAVIADFEDW